MDELINSLDELSNIPNSDSLDTILRSTNASLERRLAALLWLVALEKSPLSQFAIELVVMLQDRGRGIQEIDPFESPVGKAIHEHCSDSPQELRQLMEDEHAPRVDKIALNLIICALANHFDWDEEFDSTIKLMSGKGPMWWIDWILQNRDDDT